MSEVKANKISPATSTIVTLGDSSDTFVVATGAKIDINGTELILDADADTSITADTDDQIDIRIAGADDFQFTANKFLVQTGSTIDMNAGELILDADADTSITADTDDQIDFKVGGSDVVTIDSSGEVGIGTTSPQRHLHINNSGSATTKIQITNAATGAATDGDGFQLGISNDGTAGIEQRENLDLTFSTNNTERMRIDSAGPVTMPSQPCVMMKKSATQTNIATNTDVTVIWGNEVFDVGSNFASNTFTAPVTGKYLVNYSLRVDNLDTAGVYYYVGLMASNRQEYPIWSPGQFSADVTYWTFAGSAVIDMDTSDTFHLVLRQSTGTAQADIASGTETGTFLTIVLVA